MANPERNEPGWVGQVLRFWFEELNRPDWFQTNSAVDDAIRDRFSELFEELSLVDPAEALNSADQAVATVIVLDQFPRNLFRGTPQAFATDQLALQISELAIKAGLDEKLSVDEKLFLYLPYEHSENAADQQRAVDLVRTLQDEGFTDYALAHQAIIDRFGRFPHRNAILERSSTKEEEAFLREPNSSF